MKIKGTSINSFALMADSGICNMVWVILSLAEMDATVGHVTTRTLRLDITFV